jgi:glycine cleavage system H protein
VKDTIQEFQEGQLWQTQDGETITIGATQNGLDMAGAVLEVEISDPGDEFEAGDWIGEIRGKDGVLEMLAPCDMRITERNDEMVSQPGTLEDDPTGDAWMLRAEKLDD